MKKKQIWPGATIRRFLMNSTEMTSQWVPTACILCSLNCGLEVQIGGADGRHIERVRGDKAHPASQGYTCEKPQRLDYYQNANDRLTAPLRRRPDGAYEEIDWDTAIAEIAEKFLDIKARHGGETILYYGGDRHGNHLGGSYADSTLRALGNKFRSNALAQEKDAPERCASIHKTPMRWGCRTTTARG